MISNNSYHKLISVLFIVLNLPLFAQDTIIFKDSSSVIGIIKEKRSDEIVYKRYEVPDGPDYVILKNTIKKIHYAGGLKEQFAEPVITIKNEIQNEPFILGESKERIDIVNGKYYYKGESYSYNKIKNLVFVNHKDPRIRTMIKQKENTQAGYYASFIGIPITVVGVAAVIVGAADKVWGTGDSGIMEAGLLVTAGGIITISVNTYCFERNKYLSRKMVKVYNESF
ncbi:MAG: hypothetical protein JNL24_00825 [Bacteroidia bacterium]|nr:hypothetical protein [Bacteroidia bacterium]